MADADGALSDDAIDGGEGLEGPQSEPSSGFKKQGGKPVSSSSSSSSTSTSSSASSGPKTEKATLVVSEDDLFLPKAVVNRIVKSALPPNVLVAKETREALAYAGKVWISYLTAAANDICGVHKRSTISPADILEALEALEFEGMLPPLQQHLELSALKKKKASSTKKDKSGETA